MSKGSLLLDRDRWSLCLDADGNIALCSEPYRIAQDAACSVRVFLGECAMETDRGVPYFENALGVKQPLSVLKAAARREAMRIDGVKDARLVISNIVDRKVSGTLFVTTEYSESQFTI